MSAALSEEEKREAYEAEKALVQELFTAVGLGDLDRLQSFVHTHLHDDYSQLSHYKDANSRTPLHFAAHAGQASMCSFLRQNCGDALTLALDAQGYAPWALALRSGHLSALEALLPESFVLTARNLFDAASSGSVSCLRLVLRHCKTAKEELRRLVNEAREVGTALHGAAFSKKEEMVELVLELGADVDAQDADGVTALMVASSQGCEGIVRRLVEAGADVLKRTRHGSTSYHAAAAVGAEKALLPLLKKAKAGLLVKDDEGHVPIVLAALHDHDTTVNLLFDATKDAAAEAREDLESTLKLDFSSPEAFSTSVHKRRADAIADFEEKGRQVMTECDTRKSAGNELFKGKKYTEAIQEYSVGIESGDGFLATLEQNVSLIQGSLDTLQKRVSTEVIAPLYSNRCMALLKSQRVETALKDAETATKLAPKWPKAKYRLGQCYTALGQHAEAAQAYWDGYQLAPKADGAEALLKLFKASVKLGKQQVQEEERRKHKEAATAVYDKQIPIEVPTDSSGQNFKTLTLKYNNGESPAEVAGRFITENNLDPSLVPRVAHHVHSVMKDEREG